jgi:hypothetical protein
VTLHRLQGAPPVVVLNLAGKPENLEIPASQPLTVVSAEPASGQ